MLLGFFLRYDFFAYWHTITPVLSIWLLTVYAVFFTQTWGLGRFVERGLLCTSCLLHLWRWHNGSHHRPEKRPSEWCHLRKALWLLFVVSCYRMYICFNVILIHASLHWYCSIRSIHVFTSFEYTHISYDIYKYTYIYIDAMQFALNLPPWYDSQEFGKSFEVIVQSKGVAFWVPIIRWTIVPVISASFWWTAHWLSH